MDIIKPLIENILYPAMEKRKGNSTRKYISELQGTQDLSIDQLHALQQYKLMNLLLFCIQEIPAYKPYSHLKDFIIAEPLQALAEFPVLKKSEFQKNAGEYVNPHALPSSLIKNQTGGSTGEPTKFYIDRKTVEYYEAARWRGLSWWGITPGSRSVMIWGNPVELNLLEQKKYKLKEKWLKNRILISAYSLDTSHTAQLCSQIRDFNPEYIYGYASSLYVLANSMLEQNLTLDIKLKGVVSTAEVLHDYQRTMIAHAFQCPVINEYGAKDGGILAYECPSGGMHITSENAVLEVVEDKSLEPAENGETGLILVTDLNNFSQPRLRYVLGDRIALDSKNCNCGKGLPLMKKIEGREDDMFISKDGAFIHGHLFNHVARSLDGIAKFQIIQHDISHASLKIIPRAYDSEDIASFVSTIKNFLPECDVNVTLVDEIPASRSGKFQYSIREF